jgi:site-specific recombinase XerD
VITAFLDAMSADRALAANTIAAYRRDLSAAEHALQRAHTSLIDCGADDLRRLIGRWPPTP